MVQARYRMQEETVDAEVVLENEVFKTLTKGEIRRAITAAYNIWMKRPVPFIPELQELIIKEILK